MEKKVNSKKVVLAGLVGICSTSLNLNGLLLSIFAVVVALQIITENILAVKKEDWNLKIFCGELFRKMGSFCVIAVSGIIDILILLLTNRWEGFQTELSYNGNVLPSVIVWYIISGTGTIIKNSTEMGAPVPSFLKYLINSINSDVERSISPSTKQCSPSNDINQSINDENTGV